MLDGLDALGRHIGLVGRIFAFEYADLLRFERRPGIPLDAADTLALRDVAGETFAQQVCAHDFVVDFDHLRQVSAIIRSNISPSDMPMARACLGTMLPALMPGMELISIR